jgi:hypothetical protein
MRLHRLVLAIASVICATACLSSDPAPESKGTSFVYRHTQEFLEREALSVLSQDWPKPAPQQEPKSLLTDWRVSLSPFAEKGRRDRLRVFIEAVEGGFKVRCEQETEINDEQEDPLSLEKADWSSAACDGAFASKFLFDLHRRIAPRETWRDADIR